MALIKCSECGKEVSDKARVCQGCGLPMGVENNPMAMLLAKLNSQPARVIGKIGYLLVAIGFFMPMLRQWHPRRFSHHQGRYIEGWWSTMYGIELMLSSMGLWFIFALLGMAVGVLLLRKKAVPIFIDWIIAIACIIYSIDLAMANVAGGVFGGGRIVLAGGAYMALTGSIVAITAQIISAVKREHLKTGSANVVSLSAGKLSKSFGIFTVTGLVLSIIVAGILSGLLITLAGVISAITGIVLGILGRSKAKKEDLPPREAVTGLVLSVIGFIISLCILILRVTFLMWAFRYYS